MQGNLQIKRNLILSILLITTSFPARGQDARPLVIPLICKQGDCPLLNGVPQTLGMRSGFVRLRPGETVGWHTTASNEETLVILHGQGKALIEGKPDRDFVAPAVVYIPAETRHNVQSTGRELLEYVYVVAPARRP